MSLCDDHEVCLVIPVLEGRSDEARAFMRELEEARRRDYDRSERRIGIDREVWFMARGAVGDQLIAYMETPDFDRALAELARSQDEFDLWFKTRLRQATGLDLNDPPELVLPEMLSSYERRMFGNAA
jgi:hypothetical protein